MAKTKNRIKKMTFQTQERTLDYKPLSENDKYIIEMAGYRKQGLTENEDISTNYRKVYKTPIYLKRSSLLVGRAAVNHTLSGTPPAGQDCV